MANDVYQLNVIGVVGPQYCENVLHWDAVTAAGMNAQTFAQDLINTWISSVQASFVACLPTDYKIHGYRCRRLNNTGGIAYQKAITPVAGTRSGSSTASGIGPVLLAPYYDSAATHPKWRTGRLFFPGVASGDLTSDVFLGTLLTAINTFGTALLSGLSGAQSIYNFTVWSRKETHSYIPSTLEISLKVGTQRRRYTPVI